MSAEWIVQATARAEDRKTIRKMQNRVAAKTSRDRKQAAFDQMQRELYQLRIELAAARQEICRLKLQRSE